MPLHYLALGDSYTIGEAVPAAGRWPMQLAERLRVRGLAIDEPQIVAVTGWTTDELSAGMDAATLTPPYDLVVVRGADEKTLGDCWQSVEDNLWVAPSHIDLAAAEVELAGVVGRELILRDVPDFMPQLTRQRRIRASL